MPDSRHNKFLTQVLVKLESSFAEFVEHDETLIRMLNKASFGTVEAAKLWYDMFVADAIMFGYEVNEVDMCKFKRVEDDNSVIILVLHVDDCFKRVYSETMIDDTVVDEVTITQKRLELLARTASNYPRWMTTHHYYIIWAGFHCN